MATINVTYAELVDVLSKIKGATPATFIAETVEDMNKKNNPFHNRVTKVQKSNVFINFDYAGAVNRALVKEGKEPDFVPKPRVWGVHITGTDGNRTPLISHIKEDEEKVYLECRFLGNEPKVDYKLDGEPTEKVVFETYMKPKKEEGASQVGLEEKIIIRTFDISNICEITFGGNTYVKI